MNKLFVVTLIGALFFSSNVKSSVKVNLSEKKEYSNTANLISNNRFVELSSLGFADNMDAADKKLMLDQAITFSESTAPPPAGLSEKLNNAESLVDRAKSVYNKVVENKLFLTALKGAKLELPFGISKTIGSKTYTIVVDSIVLTPEYAYGVIYTVLNDPESGEPIAFGAKVTLGQDGGFASNGGQLFLLSNKTISFGQNNSIEFVGANGNTFVNFDCNGFTGLQAELNITLLKDQLVLESDKTKDVTFNSTVTFDNFDDWVIKLENLPPFQFKNLQDFTFSAKLLSLDRSSSKNTEEFTFPKGYNLGIDPNVWEGFCIQGLEVTLPPQFKSKGTETRKTFGIDNAIIDRRGFTGEVFGTNLITLDEGDLDSWAYSLERLSIGIYQNQFKALEFEGQVVLPVNGDNKSFAYTGMIELAQNTKYFFSVATVDNLQFPLWGASKVELFSDSRIDVTVKDKKFVADAVLSGRMNITASVNSEEGKNTPDDGASLELAQISFQQLHITTQEPYLYLDPANGAFSIGSQKLQQAMSKLPVTLSDVGLVTEVVAGNNRTGVKFTLRVNLTGNNDAGKGFGANATAVVWGEKTIKSWKFVNCELKRLELERVMMGPLTMAGYIEFFRADPVYGSGFSGGLNVDIKLVGDNKIGLEVAGIFGKIMTADGKSLLYRYWAVDAFANFPKIPVIPSLLYANGFGGGASYRMAPQKDETASSKYITKSGIGYVPKETTGLGLRAMIGVQGELSSTYNGEVAFEIVFDTDGSVTDVAFSGFVAIASKGAIAGIDVSKVKAMASKVEAATGAVTNKAVLDKQVSDNEVNQQLASSPSSAIMAQWLMRMDFTQKIFTANINVFVNVEDVITGAGAYNNAGCLNVLFAPNEWHVYVGKPSDPMGLKIVPLGLSSTSYIVMGSTIPTPVQPRGYTGAWAFASDVGAGSTKGFGFGSRFEVEMGKTGTFYYKVKAGVGYDVLLRNVKGLVCSETGQPFGIKDWYATGMAYMFLDVSAGLEVCLNVPYATCWRVWKSSCWGTRRECINEGFTANLNASITVNAPNPINIVYNTSFLGKDVTLKIGNSCSF